MNSPNTSQISAAVLLVLVIVVLLSVRDVYTTGSSTDDSTLHVNPIIDDEFALMNRRALANSTSDAAVVTETNIARNIAAVNSITSNTTTSLVMNPITTNYEESVTLPVTASLEHFNAAPISTKIPTRQPHMDLTENIKINGIASEKTLALHKQVGNMQPTVWLTGDNWTSDGWYDNSGNQNDVISHNSMGKWKQGAGDHGCNAQFVYVGGSRAAGLALVEGWPDDKHYTLFHVSRYAGPNKYRIWTNMPAAHGLNWLSGFHGGSAQRSYHNAWINKQGREVNVMNWMQTTDQYNYIKTRQADGPSHERRIDNKDYVHPVNGIGINGLAAWNYERSEFAVAEVIVYDRILSKTECSKVEEYLQLKYGF